MTTHNYWNSRRRLATRRQVLRGSSLMLAGGVAATFAGCGDDDDPSPTPAATGSAPTGTAPSATAVSATAQPKRGGTLYYQGTGEPPHHDVHKSGTASIAGYGAGAAYSGLLKPRSLEHKASVIPVGDLAEKWEQPDKTTAIFSLRANVKFQNIEPVNGRVVTAQDVVYSFNRQVAEKANASLLAGIKAVTAVDPTTLRIELSEPNVDFIPVLTAPHTKVIAREVVEKYGSLETAPVVGTGPWIFKEWKKGVGLSLVRNPDYFIAGLPYADAWEIIVLRDQAQIESQFEAGKLSIVRVASGGSGIPPKRFSSFDKQKFGVYRGESVTNNAVLFNQDFERFKDVRVRKALSLAIDRDLIVQNVLEGEGVFDALGVTFPGEDWRLPQDELKKLLAPDPKAAKAMLEQAGGPPPKQAMPTFNSAATTATGQLVQANWKEIGFETEIRPIDNVELNSGIYNPANAKYTVATAALSHPPTMTADIQQWFTVGGSRNSMKVNDPDLERLFAAQKVEFDEKARRELVNQLQRLMIDKAYMVPVTAATNTWGFLTSVHNVEPPPITATHQFFAEVWLDG